MEVHIRKEKDIEKTVKILIVRFSSIGDIILTSPLIRAVRNKFPQAEIDFLTKSQYSELLKYNPYINQLLIYDSDSGFKGLREIKKEIRKKEYDLIIDLHKNLRSLYIRTFSRAFAVKSYRKYILRRYLLVKLGINFYKSIIPVYSRYFDSVRGLNIEYDGKGSEIFITKEETTHIRNLLVENGHAQKMPVITLCPGANYFTKRWKPEGFTRLADYLHKKYNAYICLLGGKTDFELCEQIKSGISETVINLAGQFSLLQSASLLKESRLVITNDTGMMHLAQSQKTPVVAIFGCTTRELGFFPFPENSQVVEYDISCRPCTTQGLDKCPKGHFKCMEEIQVEKVIANLKI